MNRAHFAQAIALAGIALLGVHTAGATTVQKFTLSDLATKSQSIVHARVIDQSARMEEGTREIYTYITLNVLETVKGPKSPSSSRKGASSDETITIRQLGGKVDHYLSIVPGTPNFTKGEEVVLFLTGKDRAGYPWVVGLQQGKYSVVTDANGFKHVRNDVDGLKTLSPDGSVNEAKVSSEQPLNAFLDGIKTQLDLDGKVKVDPTVPTE